MGQLIIDGVTYEVYGTREDREEYLGGASHAVTWRDSDDDDAKDRAHVTATRFLDRQRWQGTRTNPAQALDWPRTGVTDAEGTAVDDSTVPLGIEHGAYELALVLFGGTRAAQDSLTAGSNVRSVGAGSARVEFFRSTLERAGRFPKPVQELVGEFLAGAGAQLGVLVTGIAESKYAEWDLGMTGGGLA